MTRFADAARDAALFVNTVDDTVAAFDAMSDENRKRFAAWFPTLYGQLTIVARLTKTLR